MTITPEDTKTMKRLLNELRQEIAHDTDQKINIAITRLVHSQKAQRMIENAELRNEIRTSEAKLNKRFDGIDQRFDKVDQRFDAVDKVLNDIVKQYW